MTQFYVGQAGSLRRTVSPPAGDLHTADPKSVPPSRPTISLPHIRRRSSRGFTLLEMIVATLIMAIAVVGLLSGISGAARNAARVREYDRVVQLARLRMNDLISAPAITSTSEQFDPDLTGGIDSGWQAQITPFLVPPDNAGVKVGLDRVRLEVWWMSGADRRTFTLEGFREHIYNPAGSTP